MNLEELKHFSMLVEFNEHDREELSELVEERSLVAGETLFCEGDEADALYLLVSGRVVIESEARGTQGELTAGAALGAISLVVIGVRQATATAAEAGEVIVLTRGAFRRLAEDAPRAACRLAEAIVADLAGVLCGELDRIG